MLKSAIKKNIDIFSFFGCMKGEKRARGSFVQLPGEFHEN